jgi:hypothetical protein
MLNKLYALALSIFAIQLCSAEPLNTYRVDANHLTKLNQKYEVISKLGSDFEVAVPSKSFKDFHAAAPNAVFVRNLHSSLSAYNTIDGVYNFEKAEQHMKNLALQYPNNVKLERYGTSTEGRPEYVLTIAKDIRQIDTSKPGILITSATHGDEVITVEVTLGLMDELLAGFGTDDRITKIIDMHTLYFIPMVCVDSFVAQTRENDGQDPNRSYPYPDDVNGHPTHAISDEMNWFAQHANIKGSIDYHAAGAMIMFPWAYTYDSVRDADYKEFDKLTTSMAEANGFEHGQISSIIYKSPGSSADYWYWKYKTLALGVEVSRDFSAISRKNISDIVKENTESTWRFIEVT